jgi:peptidyl-prolyl cis-trans isomerase D
VADAAFAAKQGALAGPGQGHAGLGAGAVDAVDAKPARSLEQVKGEITAALAAEKRKAALAALTQKIDEQFARAARCPMRPRIWASRWPTPARSPPMACVWPAGPSRPACPPPRPVVKAAFAMEHEGQPQITELVAGKSL